MKYTLNAAELDLVQTYAILSARNQKKVLQFAKSLMSEGDKAWERIIDSPKRLPKFEAFMKASLAEGHEPMDFSKL